MGKWFASGRDKERLAAPCRNHSVTGAYRMQITCNNLARTGMHIRARGDDGQINAGYGYPSRHRRARKADREMVAGNACQTTGHRREASPLAPPVNRATLQTTRLCASPQCLK